MTKTIAECHAAGMTVLQAVAATGLTRDRIYTWCYRRDVKWAGQTARREAAPLPDITLTEPDPVMCRALWAAILADQWQVALRPGLNEKGDSLSARGWFGSHDCAVVCSLAGVDFEFVMRRFHAQTPGAVAAPRAPRRTVAR